MASLPAPTWKHEPETTQQQAGTAGVSKGTKATGLIAVASPPIQSGNLLIREGIALPDGVDVASKPFSPGWLMVRQPRPAELERALNEEGWSLFCMAGEVVDRVIASNWERALRQAVQKLCERASREGLNAVEIAQVTIRKFFGIRSIRVTAKLRHIQEGPYLFKTAEQMGFELQRVRTAVPTIQMAGRRLGREHRQFKSM